MAHDIRAVDGVLARRPSPAISLPVALARIEDLEFRLSLYEGEPRDSVWPGEWNAVGAKAIILNALFARFPCSTLTDEMVAMLDRWREMEGRPDVEHLSNTVRSHIYKLRHRLKRAAGHDVIAAAKGGASSGGYHLTPEGHEWLKGQQCLPSR